MRRRRRFRRSYAGKRNGRSYFWLRFTPFAVTLRETATATHADIFLAEADFSDVPVDVNMTRKGGPRLERFICNYGLAVNASQDFFNANGAAQFAMIPEWMVVVQDTADALSVSSSLSFDNDRDNLRVIMDTVPTGAREFTETDDAKVLVRTVQGHYETKCKVNLSNKQLTVAWRGFYDEADTALNGYTDWFEPTMLISTP